MQRQTIDRAGETASHHPSAPLTGKAVAWIEHEGVWWAASRRFPLHT